MKLNGFVMMIRHEQKNWKCSGEQPSPADDHQEAELAQGKIKTTDQSLN